MSLISRDQFLAILTEFNRNNSDRLPRNQSEHDPLYMRPNLDHFNLKSQNLYTGRISGSGEALCTF